jgi:hypothetical protein
MAGETPEKPITPPSNTGLAKLKDNKWYNIGGVARIKIAGEWWTQEELEHRHAADNE